MSQHSCNSTAAGNKKKEKTKLIKTVFKNSNNYKLAQVKSYTFVAGDLLLKIGIKIDISLATIIDAEKIANISHDQTMRSFTQKLKGTRRNATKCFVNVYDRTLVL